MALHFAAHIDGLDTIKDRIEAGCTKAEHALACQAMKDTADYVPASNEMSLANRSFVQGNHVIYPGPYARYLYYGKLMVDPVTRSPYARKGATKVLTDRNLVFTREKHHDAQAFWFEASKAQNVEKWVKKAAKEVL